jgi:hypothetical protein
VTRRENVAANNLIFLELISWCPMLFCDPEDPLHRKHIKCRYTNPKRREDDKTRGVVNLVRIIAGGCIMLF